MTFNFRELLYSLLILIIIISILLGLYLFNKNTTSSQSSKLSPLTWIIKAEPVCTNGAKSIYRTRMFYTIWPGYPLSAQLTWQYDDYSSGTHTKQITASAPKESTDVQGIYVGLETESGVTLSPKGIPPNSLIRYEAYFNPPVLMAHWFWNELPSGVYSLKFNVPDSLCQSLTPTS